MAGNKAGQQTGRFERPEPEQLRATGDNGAAPK